MSAGYDPTKRIPGKTGQARVLRRSETEEEYRLWGELRNRLLNGYKFARQVPLGPYIVDFLCREKRLVVEVDGSHHAELSSDRVRTAWLNRQGYQVLRFWNHEVTEERRAVLETILGVLEGRLAERCETTRFYPALAQAAPSSGPSGHLLPAGEKRASEAAPCDSSPRRGEGAGYRMRGPSG